MKVTDDLTVRVKVKPARVMGDWECAHGRVPKNELPKSLKHIPRNEIWIRRDEYEMSQTNRRNILRHEKRELGYMLSEHLGYEKAHRKTVRHERSYR
jgi:hypothetical protein